MGVGVFVGVGVITATVSDTLNVPTTGGAGGAVEIPLLSPVPHAANVTPTLAPTSSKTSNIPALLPFFLRP